VGDGGGGVTQVKLEKKCHTACDVGKCGWLAGWLAG